MTIFILGNPAEEIDSLAIKLLPQLQKKFPQITFIHFDPTEELPTPIPSPLILIDIVVGIDMVTIFTDIDTFLLSPRVTAHDFDLPIFLGMLKKLKKIDEIKIIGIPPRYPEDSAIHVVSDLLRSLT